MVSMRLIDMISAFLHATFCEVFCRPPLRDSGFNLLTYNGPMEKQPDGHGNGHVLHHLGTDQALRTQSPDMITVTFCNHAHLQLLTAAAALA